MLSTSWRMNRSPPPLAFGLTTHTRSASCATSACTRGRRQRSGRRRRVRRDRVNEHRKDSARRRLPTLAQDGGPRGVLELRTAVTAQRGCQGAHQRGETAVLVGVGADRAEVIPGPGIGHSDDRPAGGKRGAQGPSEAVVTVADDDHPGLGGRV